MRWVIQDSHPDECGSSAGETLWEYARVLEVFCPDILTVVLHYFVPDSYSHATGVMVAADAVLPRGVAEAKAGHHLRYSAKTQVRHDHHVAWVVVEAASWCLFLASVKHQH